MPKYPFLPPELRRLIEPGPPKPTSNWDWGAVFTPKGKYWEQKELGETESVVRRAPVPYKEFRDNYYRARTWDTTPVTSLGENTEREIEVQKEYENTYGSGALLRSAPGQALEPVSFSSGLLTSPDRPIRLGDVPGLGADVLSTLPPAWLGKGLVATAFVARIPKAAKGVEAGIQAGRHIPWEKLADEVKLAAVKRLHEAKIAEPADIIDKLRAIGYTETQIDKMSAATAEKAVKLNPVPKSHGLLEGLAEGVNPEDEFKAVAGFDWKDFTPEDQRVIQDELAKMRPEVFEPKPSPSKVGQAGVQTTTLPAQPGGEGIQSFSTVVHDTAGKSVLDTTWHEHPDKILITDMFAKPGETGKGYGTKAFTEGPLKRSIETGKPMIVDELSEDGKGFFKALEKKGQIILDEFSPGEYKITPPAPKGTGVKTAGETFNEDIAKDLWGQMTPEEQAARLKVVGDAQKAPLVSDEMKKLNHAARKMGISGSDAWRSASLEEKRALVQPELKITKAAAPKVEAGQITAGLTAKKTVGDVARAWDKSSATMRAGVLREAKAAGYVVDEKVRAWANYDTKVTDNILKFLSAKETTTKKAVEKVIQVPKTKVSGVGGKPPVEPPIVATAAPEPGGLPVRKPIWAGLTDKTTAEEVMGAVPEGFEPPTGFATPPGVREPKPEPGLLGSTREQRFAKAQSAAGGGDKPPPKPPGGPPPPPPEPPLPEPPPPRPPSPEPAPPDGFIFPSGHRFKSGTGIDVPGSPEPTDYERLVDALTSTVPAFRDTVRETSSAFLRHFYTYWWPTVKLSKETGIPADKLLQVVPGATAEGENILRKFYEPVRKELGKDVGFLEQYMVAMRMQDNIAKHPGANLPGNVRGGAGVINTINDLAAKLGPERFKSVQEAAAKYWALNDEQVLKPLLNEGLIDVKQYLNWKTSYPHYIPFQREDFVTDATVRFIKSEGNVSTIGKKAVNPWGSDKVLSNPLARLEADVIRTRTLIAKNKAAKGIIDALQVHETLTGIPSVVWVKPGEEARIAARITGERLAAKSKAEHSRLKDTISYFKNGEQHLAEVDAVWGTVAKNMEQESRNMISALLQAFSAPLRKGAVTYNPAFLIINPIRDAMSAYFREGLIPFSDHYFRGWIAAVMRNSLFDEGAKAGMLMSGIVDTMRDTQAFARAKRLGPITVNNPLDALLVIPRLVGRGLEQGNIIAEQATRLGTFSKLKAAGLSDLEAAVRSRDVAVDFSKAGTMMKLINQVIPFSNAAVQGSVNVARTIRDNPARAALVSTPFMFATVATRVNNMRFDTSTMIPEYEYTNNWVLQFGEYVRVDGTRGPLYIKIPKGSIGSMITFPGEALFNLSQKNDDRSVAELFLQGGREAARTTSPIDLTWAGIMPPVMQTGVSTALGTDVGTGIPIIPVGEKSLLPEQQAGQNTSTIATVVGQKFHTSPRLIDFAIKDYLAGVGQEALWMLDVGLGALGIKPELYGQEFQTPPTPVEQATKIPLVKRFLGTSDTQTERVGWDSLDAVSITSNRAFADLPEMNRLGIRLGVAGSSINNVDLTPIQRAQYQKLIADVVIPSMKPAIEYSKKFDPETRVKYLQGYMNHLKDQARMEFWQQLEHPEVTTPTSPVTTPPAPQEAGSDVVEEIRKKYGGPK